MTEVDKTSSSIRPSIHYPRLRISDLGVRGGNDKSSIAQDDGGEANPAEEVEGTFDVEDSQPLKTLTTPELPSREIIEAHRVDHWPPRSWCDECNEGHGREWAHGRSEHKVAIISMDYAFMTRKGPLVIEGEDGWDDPDCLKILVVKDSKSGSVFAHAVVKKGIDDKRFAVDMVVRDVLWLGYPQVLLKSDNEPAIVKLLQEALGVLKVNGTQAGEEHPPPYDSQANGAVESAVRQVKCRIRAMKLCLERRIKKRIPPKHPIVAWLVSHVADLLRYRARGSDGKTPYERIRLRPFNTRLLCFAEMCKYKVRAKEPLSDDHIWHRGIFLGICQLSGQYVIFDADRSSVYKARTIKLSPMELKWDMSTIESLRATPYGEHIAREQGVAFQDRADQDGDKDAPAKKQLSRRMYIKGEDLRVFGYTVGCARCDHERRYGPGRTTKGHSDACRQRIIAELSKTPEGLRRVSAADDRMVRTVAEHIEEQQVPHAHGGEDIHVDNGEHAAADELKFEDMEQTMDANNDGPMVDRDDRIPQTPTSPARGMDDDRDDRVYQDARTPDGGGPDMEMDIADGSTDHVPLERFTDLLDKAQSDEVRRDDAEIMSLIRCLGGDGPKYRRERNKAMKAIVSEIYSPPRVTAIAKMCPSYGILPGFALDLTTHDVDGRHWDFNEAEMRERAWKKVKTEEPLLLIGSPMCTAFSAWQHINNAKRDPAVVEQEIKRAMVHLTFCCELYEYQVSRKRYFLHEHPAQATSWSTDVVKRIMNLEGVQRTVGDQCQYGAEAYGQPIRKPTGFMSNCEGIRKSLSKLCRGRYGQCSRREGGSHILCNGKVARMAAVYPVKLCKAILTGLRDQLRSDGVVIDGIVGMHEMPDEHVEQTCVNVDGHALRFDNGEGPFFDDLTKQELSTPLVKAARRKELQYFEDKHVWRRVPISEAVRASGRPPITVRWVDVNKGDDVSPDIRSRLVARQIRGAHEDPMFAPTPPLESLRTILSYAATDMEGEKPKCRDPSSPNRIQISLIDISRAYFNAKCDPANPTYVALPSEDPQHQNTCGLLLKHMYGTQAAADGWQQEYSSSMVEMGFEQGVASPCVFWHRQRSLVCSVHGDDFTTAGAKPDLDWFEAALESRYELRKGGRIGPGKNDDKEGRVLNRIVRWTDEGLEYEADPRQAERLIESMGLDGNCKSCVTPGLKPTAEQMSGEIPLEDKEHTPYRGNGARCNYIGPDRPDIQYCAKEICRWMSAPTNIGQDALKRVARFLLGRRRLVFKYAWQRASVLECYSDTDWAGCPKTRKSTSGGCLMLGGHLLKSWSSTQPSISLSSGEAEYYGVVKASGIALGQQSLMKDLGMNVRVRVWTDSSAAVGICGRSGLGKLRHVQTHTLWVQERVKSGAIELRKVNGLVNPADLFTKHLQSRERVDQLVKLFNCEYRDGRAASAPQLRKNDAKPEVNVAQTEADPNNTSRPHDPDVLPHDYNDEDLDEIFYKAVVPGDGDGAAASTCICGRPDCLECFPAEPRGMVRDRGLAEAWLTTTTGRLSRSAGRS